MDEGDAVRVVQARAWLNDYLVRLIERKELEQAERIADAEQGSLLDGLIAVRNEGEQLHHDEPLAMSFLLLIAGYETTANLITNGLLSLLRNPDQYAALRADPALTRPAIEELLRYESPVKLTPFVRITTTEVTIGGVVIPAHQPVLISFAAANRDPAHFPDPDRLDVARRENRHIAFGFGIHFCLGAPLARIEGQVAIGTLLRRMPALKLVSDTPEWRESSVLRGLKALPVTF